MQSLSRFDIFLSWLHDLGGFYDFYRPEPDPPRRPHDPPGRPTQRPLDPKRYRKDAHGSVRKLSEHSLAVAEKLGI